MDDPDEDEILRLRMVAYASLENINARIPHKKRRARVVQPSDVLSAKRLREEPEEPEAELMVLHVPSSHVPNLIGLGGHKVNQMQRQSGAKIQVGRLDQDGFRAVAVTGTYEAQLRAKELIDGAVNAVSADMQEVEYYKESQRITLPAHLLKFLVGPKGSQIQALTAGLDVRTYTEETADPQTRSILMQGNIRNFALARERIERRLLDVYRERGLYNKELEERYSTINAQHAGPCNGSLPLRTSGGAILRNASYLQQGLATEWLVDADEAPEWADLYSQDPVIMTYFSLLQGDDESDFAGDEDEAPPGVA